MTDCRHRTRSHERTILTAGPIARKLPQIRTQTEMIFSLGKSDNAPKHIGFELTGASAKGRTIRRNHRLMRQAFRFCDAR